MIANLNNANNRPKKILKLIKVQDDNFGALEHFFDQQNQFGLSKRQELLHPLHTPFKYNRVGIHSACVDVVVVANQSLGRQYWVGDQEGQRA